MTAVIDAAALLAVLLEERGAEIVLPVLRNSLISAVNASECCSRAVERGASAVAVLAIIRSYQLDISPFDLPAAIETAALREETRHVGASLGDRACIALARATGFPVYTADTRLGLLKVGVDIRLIR